MGTYRQRLLYNLTACMAFLAGEARIDSYHLVTGSLSLLFKDSKKRAPTGVHDRLSKMMVLDHVRDSQVFNGNALIPLSIRFSHLKVMIAALPLNLEMRLGHGLRSLTASMTAL